jgi:hypothetical protein
LPAEPIHVWRCEERDLRVVARCGRERGGKRIRDEEAIPEEGAFEYKVDESVEKMPDEEYAYLEGSRLRQDFYRSTISATEQSEYS